MLGSDRPFTLKVKRLCLSWPAGRTSRAGAGWFALAGVVTQRCARVPFAECVSSCAGVDQVTCPVLAVKPLLASLKSGEGLFAGITPGDALAVLRKILRNTGVGNPGSYRTHDLRRGHALDLQLSGVIVPAVPACCVYLARCRRHLGRNSPCWGVKLASVAAVLGHVPAGARCCSASAC